MSKKIKLLEKFPELLKEWDTNKNKVNPQEVSPSSHKIYWWVCLKGHSYDMTAYNRHRIYLKNKNIDKSGCPYCFGRRVGYGNDLKSNFPKLVEKEWDFKKNSILPNQVRHNSSKLCWWICPKNHTYQSTVGQRTLRSYGCPFCSGHKVGQGNDFKTLYPEIAKEWDTKKNLTTPDMYTFASEFSAWWICEKGHSYESRIVDRTRFDKADGSNRGCPYCSSIKIGQGNDLQSNYPELVKNQWDFKKNKKKPNEVVPGSDMKVWWICPKKHSFESQIKHKVVHQNLCPFCSNRKVGYGNDLQSTHPELIKEWDFKKNKINPNKLTKGSRAKVWWLCDKQHSFDETVKTRTVMKTGCPFCNNKRVGYGNDLQSTHPELIKEWDFESNNIMPNQITYGSNYRASWICLSGHTWKAKVSGRTDFNDIRTGCPYCSITPRSKEEIYLLFELKKFFNIDENDHKIKLNRIADVDIKIPLEKIVIEYDGSYWHKDKAETDKNKTKELNKKGWLVVRVREKPLKILSRKYNVSSTPNKYKETADKVLKKLNNLGYEVRDLDKYLSRKKLINKDKADKFIAQLIKEKNKKT